MSFLADKKREHENAAEKALMEKDYGKAFFHTAKAAEFSLALAEQTEGKIAISYVNDAFELLDIAAELKKKARAQQPPQRAERQIKDQDKGDREEVEDWLVTEKPNIRLADVAGMEEVKTKLAEMVIEPLKHPETAKKWGLKAGGGILLYGPPGTGKTTLGKAVAGELDAAFFYATGAQIRSKWHGESEQRLRKLIQAARAQSVAVLFLDDVDGLLPKRGGDSVVDNRIVVQFLAEIGGFTESENVLLVLGATNKPWDIDEAVFRTGRFDEKIYIGPPDKEARKFLINRHLPTNAPVEPELDKDSLAERLEGYSGSDVVAIITAAKRAAFRREVSGGDGVLRWSDIENAMKTIPSSITDKMIKRYEEFAAQRFK